MYKNKGATYLGVAIISALAFAVMGPIGLVVLGVCLVCIGSQNK